MRLVVLYGPPGVGKLTVAKILAKRTGYRLFHNHLSTDLVSEVFPQRTKARFDAINHIRLYLIEAAAKSDLKGMIFTYVYAVQRSGETIDDAWVRGAVRKVAKHRGKIFFVKLTCNEDALHRRLRARSRKKFRKLRSVRVLRKAEEQYHFDKPIPFVKNLVIDNTSIAPQKAATMIQKFYKL